MVVLAACGTAGGAVIEGPVFNPANGHTYVLLDKTTWTASEAQAVTLGGHLASVNSAAESQFLLDNFCSGVNDRRTLWIGLTDNGSEGTFHWTSGEPLAFTNWMSGEPNNHAESGGPENFVSFNWNYAPGLPASSPRGTWNDDIDNGHPGVARHAPGPFNGVVELVPEPGAAHLLVFTCATMLLLARRDQGGLQQNK